MGLRANQFPRRTPVFWGGAGGSPTPPAPGPFLLYNYMGQVGDGAVDEILPVGESMLNPSSLTALESRLQIIAVKAGTLQNMQANVAANSLDQPCTVKVRVNGVTVASAPIGAGATGVVVIPGSVAVSQLDLISAALDSSSATSGSIQLSTTVEHV